MEKASRRLTTWIGTPQSIIVHTVFFIVMFALSFFGFGIDEILLILTTAVSLEAIYLAIFIQMTVNRTTQSLETVERDIDDIQEDVEDLGEDVDSLEENVKGISEDYIEEEKDEDDVVKALKDIENRLKDLQGDITVLKKKGLF